VKPSITNVTGKTRKITRVPDARLGGVVRFRVRHILVPTDFSPVARKALRYARPLAKRFGARITLLHVVAPITYQADYGYGAVTRSVPDQGAMCAARRRLGSIARSKCQAARQTSALVRSGYAPDEIVNVACKLKTDLIVIGERSARRSGSNTNATTAEQTVRVSPCPVVVVRENGAELLRKERTLHENQTHSQKGFSIARIAA
jgi:universal stress protein A